jgi:hypothetical protein
MTPGRYTELFFLDEATALAAGHRPCRECRYQDHEYFKASWLRGNKTHGLAAGAGIDAIDAVLHQERVTPNGAKVTFQCPLRELPDGVLIVSPAAPDRAVLVAQGRLWNWMPRGYTDAGPRPRSGQVSVLTPHSTVRAIAAGYVPQWHHSAQDSMP